MSKPSLRQGKSMSRSGPDRVPRCMTHDKICNMQTIGLAQGDLNEEAQELPFYSHVCVCVYNVEKKSADGLIKGLTEMTFMRRNFLGLSTNKQ